MQSVKLAISISKFYLFHFAICILQFIICNVLLPIDLTQDDIDAPDHSNHIGDQTPFNHL